MGVGVDWWGWDGEGGDGELVDVLMRVSILNFGMGMEWVLQCWWVCGGPF